MVVISRPWASMASTEQEYTALPSIKTVQAPQVPRSHTRLAPVSSNLSRSASSSVTRGSNCAFSFLPLTLRDTGTLPGPCIPAFSSASASAPTWVTSGAAAVTPEILRKSRRETPELDPEEDALVLFGFLDFAGLSGRSSTEGLHDYAEQSESAIRN